MMKHYGFEKEKIQLKNMLTLYDLDPSGVDMSFPPLHLAWGKDTPAPGLLARGGDLSIERLKAAYAEGIFPWFGEEDPILWWSLDPRMVLYPQQFKFSRSLRKTLKQFLQSGHEVKIDTAFSETITQCALIERPHQGSTWITDEIKQAYACLHQQGIAHSFEAWADGELVGGLYGVSLGGMFYGESMFSKQVDASKLALCGLIAFALTHHIQLIDCQQETPHLKSLGAVTIAREKFAAEMKLAQTYPVPPWGEITLSAAEWGRLDLEPK